MHMLPLVSQKMYSSMSSVRGTRIGSALDASLARWYALFAMSSRLYDGLIVSYSFAGFLRLVTQYFAGMSALRMGVVIACDMIFSFYRLRWGVSQKFL